MTFSKPALLQYRAADFSSLQIYSYEWKYLQRLWILNITHYLLSNFNPFRIGICAKTASRQFSYISH